MGDYKGERMGNFVGSSTGLLTSQTFTITGSVFFVYLFFTINTINKNILSMHPLYIYYLFLI